MKHWWIGLSLLTLVVSGCVKFQSKPLEPSQTLAAFESRNLADAGLRAFLEANGAVSEWPPKAWDLRLLTLAAFYFHPDLDVARAEAKTVRASELTAGERPNPTLGFAPEYNASTPANTVSPWTLGFSLDVPIETAGKRGYRLAQAAQLSEAARLAIGGVAWKVRSGVRAALLDLHAAMDKESLLYRQREIQAENANLLKLQLEAGAVSPFEVSQARIALDTTILEFQNAAQKKDEAQAALAAAIGLPATALSGIVWEFQDFASAPPAIPSGEARRLALLNRPDILSALADYAAAQAALQLEIAKQYPDVNIGPGYTFDQDDDKWSVGVSVELPVFSRNRGAIAEAEARRAEKSVRFAALQAQAVGQIEQAAASLNASLRTLRAANDLGETAFRRQRAAQAMFLAGETMKLEYSNAQLEFNTSELARQDAKTEAHRAWGRLEDALQCTMEITSDMLKLAVSEAPAAKESQ